MSSAEHRSSTCTMLLLLLLGLGLGRQGRPLAGLFGVVYNWCEQHAGMQLAGAELSVLDVPCWRGVAWRASPDIYWRIDPSADRLPRNSALADPLELMLYANDSALPGTLSVETRRFMYRVVSDKLSESWQLPRLRDLLGSNRTRRWQRAVVECHVECQVSQITMSGKDWRNTNVFRRWRKADEGRRCLDVGWQWVPNEWCSDWKCPSSDSC